jgi:hypothetical protein
MSNAKWEISQLHHDKNKQVLDQSMMSLPLKKTITLTMIIAVLVSLIIVIYKPVIDETIAVLTNLLTVHDRHFVHSNKLP